MSTAPALLNITDTARQQMNALIHQRGKDTTEGLLLGVATKGCSGLSYTLEYIDKKTENLPKDTIQCDGFSLYIDPKAIMFIIGITIDYKATDLEEGFTFNNPLEKGRCGCGTSFYV